MNKKLAITIGDPSGIGSEIIVKSLQNNDFNFKNTVLIGNREVFKKAEALTGLKIDKNIEIIDIPCDISKIKTGKLSVESGNLSYLALEHACRMAVNGNISEIVTAPLSKKAINMAGYDFSGQTEILQHFLGEKDSKAEMLFVAGDFRVLLLTRHIPVCEVSKALTFEKVVNTVLILNNSLKNAFDIANPNIALCGLNPHAGEDGLLGEEELKILIPAVEKLKNQYKINITMPFPADALFSGAAKAYLQGEKQPFDCYLACYHDQGLIPVKMLAFKESVNTTIGLSVLRTSPAHGTAFDIAGKNIADPTSMLKAMELAIRCSRMREKCNFSASSS